MSGGHDEREQERDEQVAVAGGDRGDRRQQLLPCGDRAERQLAASVSSVGMTPTIVVCGSASAPPKTK